MRAITFTLIVAFIIMLCGVWYVFYRKAQASALSRIDSLSAIVGVPPSVCKSTSADAAGSGDGLLYVYNNRLVLDVAAVIWGQPGRLRVLIDSDRNYWPAPESAGAIPPNLSADDQKTYVDNIIFSNTWDCSPWWLPDESVFNISHGDNGMQ